MASRSIGELQEMEGEFEREKSWRLAVLLSGWTPIHMRVYFLPRLVICLSRFEEIHPLSPLANKLTTIAPWLKRIAHVTRQTDDLFSFFFKNVSSLVVFFF